MTEAEWLVCEDPTPMLHFLHGRASDRKLRLFLVECCRRVWHLLIDERSRRAVEFAERVADGNLTKSEREVVHIAAAKALNEIRQSPKSTHKKACENAAILATATIKPEEQITILGALIAIAQLSGIALQETSGLKGEEAEMKTCSMTLRELFTFRPLTLNSSWLTSTVLALANGIYSERAFHRMPILADALQDAGCENEDILNHCRQPGEHVRGCWVLDLALSKE